MNGKKILAVLLVVSFPFLLRAEPKGFDEIRPLAVETLRREMHDGAPESRVLAAEALLQLGYIEGVEELFLRELSVYGDRPQSRIGLRRVLARAAVVPQKQQERIAEIKAVFFDSNASDRDHAIEALEHLGVRFTETELTAIRRYARDTENSFAIRVLARHADPAAAAEMKRKIPESSVPAEDRLLLLPLLTDPDPATRVFAATALLRLERQGVYRLGIVDGLVIGGYFLSLILIGWYYARRTGTTEDYLLGGRNMKPWMVGLSLFAALLSTASYMSVPGEIVKHGPMIMAQLVCIPLVIWVVGWFLIPAFMKLKVTSANELLELRLGLSVRMLGSGFFLFSRLAWMAMIIYITAKAVLAPVLGLGPEHLPWLCLLLGVITMAYTSSGGLKAAVLADVIQSFILYFGAVLSIALITFRLGGFEWFPTEWAPTWDPPVFWFDSKARITFAGAGMLMFSWYICTAGSDQVAVQRYLATRDVKAARAAFNINLLAVAVVILFLGILGFALYGYFLANPHELADGMNLRTDADRIFPHFIVSGLPAGFSGLIIAGLMAAALSSLSAGLNSTCAVVTVDFLNRFSKKKQDEKSGVKQARLVSLSIGVVVVLLSLLVDRVEGNFTEVINKIANLLVAPLFVLFFMAIFIRRATPAGVWAGAAVSVAVAVSIAFFGLFGLSFIWIIPCSLLSGILTACLISLLMAKRRT